MLSALINIYDQRKKTIVICCNGKNPKLTNLSLPPLYTFTFSFGWGFSPEKEKHMKSNDLKKLEEIVNEQDTEQFYLLIRYWKAIGEEYAFNDANTELRLLADMPTRDNQEENAEFIRLLADFGFNLDDPNLLEKSQKMLIKAIENENEKRIEKVSRFIYLLGVRTAVNRLKERANECLDAIHDKYKDALVNVVELQRKMGI